jgi:hypothetical protein
MPVAEKIILRTPYQRKRLFSQTSHSLKISFYRKKNLDFIDRLVHRPTVIRYRSPPLTRRCLITHTTVDRRAQLRDCRKLIRIPIRLPCS